MYRFQNEMTGAIDRLKRSMERMNMWIEKMTALVDGFKFIISDIAIMPVVVR